MDIFHLFKKKVKQFKKIIQKNNAFVLWVLLVLSFDYLGLFFIESILPGYVMLNLNLNFLLIFVLIGWLIYSISIKPQKSLLGNFNKIFGVFLFLIFVLGFNFTLYKMANWELFVSFSFLIIISYLLYKELKHFF